MIESCISRGMEGTLGVLYNFEMSFQKGIGCIQKYGIRSINHFNMGNLGWISNMKNIGFNLMKGL